MADSCVFCDIIAGQAPATVVREWPDAIAIVPLFPVSDGHVIVIPRVHVDHAAIDPAVTAAVAARAAELMADLESANLITSMGPDSSKSIDHLHIHVVERKPGDGLLLPWSDPGEISVLRARLEAALAKLDIGGYSTSWEAMYGLVVDARSILRGRLDGEPTGEAVPVEDLRRAAPQADQSAPPPDRTGAKCATACDRDCEALCHEVHAAPADRLHDVAECEARQTATEPPAPFTTAAEAFPEVTS